MWYSRCSKIMPSIIDIFLFVLVVSSILVSINWLKVTLLSFACAIMVALIAMQLTDSFKQKMFINLNMIYSALQVKQDPLTRIIKDLIIYGLHIYLFTINNSYLYFASFGLCIVYDLIVYNIAFNPIMQKYLGEKLIKQYEEQKERFDK